MMEGSPGQVPSEGTTSMAILDEAGRTLILRGINLGNKVSPYVPEVTDEDFARIASWGFNTIRFLILWAAIEPEESIYNDDYFNLVTPYLDMAYANDLHVILDMHQDVYGEMFDYDGAPAWACPAELVEGFEHQDAWWMDYFTKQVMSCFTYFWREEAIQDHFIESFRRAALHLGNHPAVVGFDLFNEPYPGYDWTPRFEAEQLQPFYERLIPVIRNEAPNAYIFVEPWVLRDYFVSTHLQPFDYNRLVYFPHFYHIPMELNSTYSGRDLIVRDWVESVAEEAATMGLPFAVGEYGGDTNGDGIGDLLEDFNEAMDDSLSGGMYWEYGKGDGGFRILASDGTEKSWIVDAVMRAYPRRTAGELVEFAFAREGSLLNITYLRDASISEPTEIALPARLYPHGFRVYMSDPETMDWEYDADRSNLAVFDQGEDGLERTVDVLPY